MIELSLALRNLNRNKRRSIATLLAMAIGSTAILMFSGYSANIRYSMQTAYARNSGHLQIQHRDFFLYGSGNPSAYGIQNYQQLVQAIKSDPSLAGQVTVVTPTLQFGAIAGNYAAGVSRTVVGVGMVAVDHNRMRAWNEYGLPLHSPTFALEGAAPDAAIVGVGVARVLQLCDRLEIKDCPSPIEQQPQLGKVLPSDIATLAMSEAPAAGVATIAIPHAKLDLLASTANGTPNVVSLQVIRAERQGFKELDEVYLMLNLQQAQRLIYGRSSPKATSIMIQLSRTEQIPSARDRLTKLVAEVLPDQPLSLRDFRELNPFFVQTTRMFDTLFGFVFALIGSIVLFSVSNTMNTAVVERTVEVGTIRAIGLRRAGVQRLFVLEGMLLGVVGAIGGAAFAVALSLVVNRLGLTWLPPGSGEPLPLLLLIWGETSTIVGTTVGLIAIATLSAWWPAYRASRLVIVDALRHV